MKGDDIVMRGWMKVALLGALAVCALVSAAQGIRVSLRPEGSMDFQWEAPRALLLHVDPYHPNPGWALVDRTRNEGDFYARQPPSCFVMLWPYAALPLADARVAWLLTNLALTAALLWVIRRSWLASLSPWAFACFSALVAASTPWRVAVGNGQSTLFALGFLVLGYHASTLKRPVLAGICLALSLYKYTLTGPVLLWMALDGAAVAVGVAALIHLALTLFASYWIGVAPLSLVLGSFGSAGVLAYMGCTDIFGLGYALAGMACKPYVIAFIAASLLMVAMGWRRGRREALPALTILSAWALLVAYHRFYDLLFLIFPLAQLFTQKTWTSRSVVYAAVITWLWYVQRILDQFGAQKSIVFVNIVPFTAVLLVFLLSVDDRPGAPVQRWSWRFSQN